MLAALSDIEFRPKAAMTEKAKRRNTFEISPEMVTLETNPGIEDG